MYKGREEIRDTTDGRRKRRFQRTGRPRDEDT
jgi:hypothetical protein